VLIQAHVHDAKTGAPNAGMPLMQHGGAQLQQLTRPSSMLG